MLGMPSTGGVKGTALVQSGCAVVVLDWGAVLRSTQQAKRAAGGRGLVTHEDEVSLIAVLGTNTGAARCSAPSPEMDARDGPLVSGDAKGVACALGSVGAQWSKPVDARWTSGAGLEEPVGAQVQSKEAKHSTDRYASCNVLRRYASRENASRSLSRIDKPVAPRSLTSATSSRAR